MDTWISELKTGDAVYVGRNGRLELATVANTTATQIIVGTTRYNKSDGRERTSNTYYKKYLMQSTPETAELKAQAEFRTARNNACNVKWDRLSLDKLTRILAIVDESE